MKSELSALLVVVVVFLGGVVAARAYDHRHQKKPPAPPITVPTTTVLRGQDIECIGADGFPYRTGLPEAANSKGKQCHAVP